MRDLGEAYCTHGNHIGPCGYKYVETVRDDVSYGGVPATGIVRDILVGVCQCDGVHE